MKCPDCSSRLSEMTVGNKLAYRCFKCGGFWADSDVVNSLSSAELATWRRISVDPRWFSGGSGMCPLDGTKLARYTGDSIPARMMVKRCVRCGKWWFSGDTLHEFKPAQEAKFNYYRLWGVTNNVTEIFLPLLLLVVLGAGMAVGVTLLRNRQQIAVPAAEPVTISNWETVYTGSGEVTVSFTADGPVYQLEYRRLGEIEWKVEPVEVSGSMYRAGIKNVAEGVTYEVRVAGQVAEFEAQ